MLIPASNKVHPHNENLPKVIFKPNGEILAIWGAANPSPKNKYSGIIFYAQSFDQGKSWTEARPLVSDTSGFDQRYFDVALMPDGEAGIIWLDNRKTISNEGSGLYYAETNGKNGFSSERMIAQPSCQCCRTKLYIDEGKNVHVLFRGILNDSIRDMMHMVSGDEAKTFSSPSRISEDNWVIMGCPHTGPSMTSNQKAIHFSWFTGGNISGTFYNHSTDGGRTFSEREKISERGMHPQMTSTPDGNIWIVWDEPSMLEGSYNKRIGMQVRSPEGKILSTNYLSSDTVDASYPVIQPLGNNQVMVAYAAKQQGNSLLQYAVLGMEELDELPKAGFYTSTPGIHTSIRTNGKDKLSALITCAPH